MFSGGDYRVYLLGNPVSVNNQAREEGGGGGVLLWGCGPQGELTLTTPVRHNFSDNRGISLFEISDSRVCCVYSGMLPMMWCSVDPTPTLQYAL